MNSDEREYRLYTDVDPSVGDVIIQDPGKADGFGPWPVFRVTRVENVEVENVYGDGELDRWDENHVFGVMLGAGYIEEMTYERNEDQL